jgi:hypothetical protein
MGERDRRDVISTYRHLRLAMIFLLALLIGAVALQTISAGCAQGSLSAFFYTPVQAVFVAALCALGTCLIVYRGNTDLEDVALNISGFLAFVVAFVPTDRPTGTWCVPEPTPRTNAALAALAQADPEAAARVRAALRSDQQSVITDGINNNVVALVAVALAVIVVALWLLLRARRTPGERDAGAAGRPVVPIASALVCFALLVGGAAVFATERRWFYDHAHAVAAVLTFVGIVTVVVANLLDVVRTVPPVERRDALVRAYGAVAGAMALTAVVVGGLTAAGWRHGVLWLEVLLLGEFLAFWVVQTLELGFRRSRLDEAPPTVEVRAAEAAV